MSLGTETLLPPPCYELQLTLSQDSRLPPAFGGLSVDQRECYEDWVASAPNASERRSRSHQIANVVRVLFGLKPRSAPSRAP